MTKKTTKKQHEPTAMKIAVSIDPETGKAQWRQVEPPPEGPELDRGRLGTLARETMRALHQQRADQLVAYQMDQPLSGQGRATATIFLPPTLRELVSLKNALIVTARAENTSIRRLVRRHIMATGDQALAALARALDEAIAARWQPDSPGSSEYTLAE